LDGSVAAGKSFVSEGSRYDDWFGRMSPPDEVADFS
jgi:hypothetical protein